MFNIYESGGSVGAKNVLCFMCVLRVMAINGSRPGSNYHTTILSVLMPGLSPRYTFPNNRGGTRISREPIHPDKSAYSGYFLGLWLGTYQLISMGGYGFSLRGENFFPHQTRGEIFFTRQGERFFFQESRTQFFSAKQ